MTLRIPQKAVHLLALIAMGATPAIGQSYAGSADQLEMNGINEPYSPGEEPLDLELNLRNWTSLEQDERQSIIASSVENLLMIERSLGRGDSISGDKCWKRLTIKKMEKKLISASSKKPKMEFASAFMKIANCEKI